MRKTLLVLFSACLIFASLCLTACERVGDPPQASAGIQSIQKTATEGNVDTYTVTLTDGTTTAFTVTNGTDGVNGTDGNSITGAEINEDGELVLTFSKGEPVNVGKVVGAPGEIGPSGVPGVPGPSGVPGTPGVGIVSITKISTVGKVDTYSVNLSDASSVTFTVTNGMDGSAGVGIADVILNDYELTVELTNGQSLEFGNIRGAQGESAYDIYKRKYNYTGTEEEWLQLLMTGGLANATEVSITFDPANGEEYFSQKATYGGKVLMPETQPKRDGYLFGGWYYEDEPWLFNGSVVTEDMILTAKWDYALTDLPVVDIDTAGVAITSNEDYVDAIVSVVNCGSEIHDAVAGIRLRGNSTRWQPKKPYRIKFDKKQSLFGLDPAKSWVLLAEFLDPSSLNNTVAMAFAKQLPSYTFIPTMHKVNVYLNGKYNGLYTLCEQVQENPGRMDIEMDEITEDMTDLKDYNFFIGMEGAEPPDPIAEPNAVEDETYFKVQLASGFVRYFELKYPEKGEFPSDEQFASFMSQLKTYTTALFQAFEDKNKAWIDAETNVNTLIDYLIVDEVMGQRDHHQKSFNLYYTNTSDVAAENGKINFGPIWDYDWSLNVPWDSAPNDYFEVTDTLNYSNICFSAVRWMPEYYQMVKDRWNDYGIYALNSAVDLIDRMAMETAESLRANQVLWYDSIDEELTKKNIEFLKAFLINRRLVLNREWAR